MFFFLPFATCALPSVSWSGAISPTSAPNVKPAFTPSRPSKSFDETTIGEMRRRLGVWFTCRSRSLRRAPAQLGVHGICPRRLVSSVTTLQNPSCHRIPGRPPCLCHKHISAHRPFVQFVCRRVLDAQAIQPLHFNVSAGTVVSKCE